VKYYTVCSQCDDNSYCIYNPLRYKSCTVHDTQFIRQYRFDLIISANNMLQYDIIKNDLKDFAVKLISDLQTLLHHTTSSLRDNNDDDKSNDNNDDDKSNNDDDKSNNDDDKSNNDDDKSNDNNDDDKSNDKSDDNNDDNNDDSNDKSDDNDDNNDDKSDDEDDNGENDAGDMVYYNIVIVDDTNCPKIIGKYCHSNNETSVTGVYYVACYAYNMIYTNHKLYGIDKIPDKLIFSLCRYDKSDDKSEDNTIDDIYTFVSTQNTDTNKVSIEPFIMNESEAEQTSSTFNILHDFIQTCINSGN
jgi:hypothetical protein